MQQKKIISGLQGLVLASLFFASCKKENTVGNPVVEPKAKQLVSIEFSNAAGNPLNFLYDAKGRVSSSGNSYFSLQYDYSGNVFHSIYTSLTTNSVFELKNGMMDAQGRLLDADAVSKEPGQPESYYKYHFTYDAEGHLLQFSNTSLTTGGVSQDDNTWSNGDLITTVNTYNGQPQYRLDYTYYDSLPNKLNLAILPQVLQFYTDGITGKRSAHLLKTETNFKEPQHTKKTEYFYDYDLDEQGYPVKYRMKSLMQNLTLERFLKFN
ncbi:MAG: DUF4595 domain-containing protein [Chitinophagaceae bacterium]